MWGYNTVILEEIRYPTTNYTFVNFHKGVKK